MTVANANNRPEYEGLLAFATALAQEAGLIMRKYSHGMDQQVETKDNDTLLTVADKQINDLVIQRVKEQYSTHGVLGEEASYNADRHELWVCDPIDGTNGFTIGEPTATFSLAYVVGGMPIVAVTYDPFQNRLYSAAKGYGAFCGSQPLRVSRRSLGSALVAGSGSFKEVERLTGLYRNLASQGVRVRLFGGMVYKGNLIAEGKLDGVLFAHDGAHDIAAIKLLVEEAGGVVSNIDGSEQLYDRPIRGAIVSNGIIHQELLRAVQAFGVGQFLAR